MIPVRSQFPDDFVFGAATAAYQIEGHANGGAGPTHWDSFAATPGNVVRAEDGAHACDHYHRWPEDLDLIAAANLDAYRFSTSWARVMPDGVTVNPEGLDFYDRLVDGCLARGLAPFATLYHWELPSTLADKGGWANRDTALRFADFAGVVADRIGDRLASLATLNEPWCVSWLSHFEGHHAPGLRDIRATARAMHHVCLAHGLGMQALRAQGQGNLGVVCNFEFAEAGPGKADAAAATLRDAIYNRWFVEAFTAGTYPDAVLEGLGPHMPQGWQDDVATIAAPLDWFGVNYYTRCIVTHDATLPWPHIRMIDGPLPKNSMGWEVYPDGLHHFLTRLHRDHTGDTPLYVTENGMPLDDVLTGGAIADPRREDFIADHLGAARRAIAEGVPLKGFFYWSLLDNYEWAFGYEKRFGLIHVDFDTFTRTPKASYHALARALAKA
ncbi:GH1 family beta-glucosidase [Anianabacter salinae]|uniref:GH1 family beta-glucosidase n=1 Tax=Anianabacter salinae TaxID=2851023 RepID=UPI00225E0EA5|nr:GH1 family beta-glucosidase [Anianabacter salinae]MBV0912081.1 beta-glucosidase [Anianabacter salinae]